MPDETPPALEDAHGEEHLPGPSFWPILLALGVAMSLVIIILSFYFFIFLSFYFLLQESEHFVH